jgi:hypothetical protein
MSILNKTLRSPYAQRLADAPVVKLAALGGEPETGFEQSFAGLAFTYIQDKAPGLLDYLVGFQLVDKSSDNKRAVGIFGFKVSDQWIYIPVFFINGNLKGHELLYLKNQDTFVPLKENWVNYIISRKPQILGEATPDTPQDMGMLEPNLNSMGSPPQGGKFASDMHVPPSLQKWAKDAMPLLASWATQSPATMAKYSGLSSRLEFSNFLKQDVRLAKLAMDIAEGFPGVKHAMDDLYPDVIRKSLLSLRDSAVQSEKSAGSVLRGPELAEPVRVVRTGILGKIAAADPVKKVEIHTDETITKNVPEMTDAEHEKLLKDGYLIKDHRNGEEVSVAYNTQVEMSLSNPDCTDVYEVLIKPHSFEKCLVIHHPHGARGRQKHAVLISLEDSKKWENVHPTRLFAKQQARSKSDVETYGDWFDKLPDNKSVSKNGTYVIVSKNGQGTSIFEVNEDLGDDCYRVNWEEYSGHTHAEYTSGAYSNGPICCSIDGSGDRVETIYFNTREGSSFKSVNGKMYIPAEAKVIKIKDPPKCTKCDKAEESCNCDYFKRDWSEKHKLRPGNLADLQLEILQKTAETANFRELKVWSDHNETIVGRKRMNKMAAFFHLVRDHGLRVKQARHIMREADRLELTHKAAKFYIKYAQGMGGPYEAGQGPTMGGFPEPQMGTDPAHGGVPSMGPETQFQGVPDMQAANTDPAVYDPTSQIDPMAMQVAQQGQQQGQKEIFDTSMVSSMLKAVQEDSLIDKFLPDLMKALDRLGRILFMYYWHNEEFTNRYGKQDMPELEDTLRNAFEVLGNLVLFLKEKSIGPVTTSDFGAPGVEASGGI